MSFNWRKYASSMWSGIKDRILQDATRDQSEKVGLLARDLYLYVQEMEKKLEERTADLEAIFNTSGVVIIVTGTACPTGWEEDTTWRNRFLQGPDASGANIGTTGAEAITIASDGSHAHVMPNHRHVISSQAAHDHSLYYDNIGYSAGGIITSVVLGGYKTYTANSHDHGGYTGYNTSENTQGAGSHSHTASGISPAFKRALFCKKAA